MLDVNSLTGLILTACSLFVNTSINCQTELFRGVVETKSFYTTELVEIPSDIAGLARVNNISPSELDTLYEHFTICGDTLISELYSKNQLLEVTSVQVRKDFFFRYKKSEEFLRFKPMAGGALEFKKENWKKIKTRKEKKDYDYFVTGPINKTFNYYMSIDDSRLYDYQLGLGRSFSYVFNPYGTYHKVKRVYGDGERLTLYKYKPDPDCTCRLLLEGFKLADITAIDPNILPTQVFTNEIIPPENRKVLPSFEVDDQLGQFFSQKDLLGKLSYIDLWATWCKPCLAETPYLKSIDEEYKTQGLQVVSISLDKIENYDLWVDLTKERELNWTNWILYDGLQSEFAKALELTGIPRFLLVDMNGRIANENAPRPSDKEALKALLDQFIKE